MRNTIFILLFLNALLGYSQIKNGSIIYGKVNADIDPIILANSFKNLPSSFIEKHNKVTKDSDKITYTLNFIDKESYFFANPIMLEDNSLFASFVGVGHGKLKYYQNDNTKEYREYRDSRRTGKTILNRKENFEWTLVNETKIIDGRKCYKATSPTINDDGKKYTNPQSIITAWYTPEIPVSIGPLGYGGLPGLILELQKSYVTFFVKKINLNLDKDPKIDRLTDLKAISNEDYNEMAKSTLTKEQLEGIEEANQKKK